MKSICKHQPKIKSYHLKTSISNKSLKK